jgi:hypothetical protein
MRPRFANADGSVCSLRRPRGGLTATALVVVVLALCFTAGASAAPLTADSRGVAPRALAPLGPVVSFVQQERAITTASPGKTADTTLFSDGFESGMTSWRVTGSPTWAKTTYRAGAGSASAYCAGSSIVPPGPYANNMDGWMEIGPFDLTNYTAATLSFKMYCQTEKDKDVLSAWVSLDDQNFYGKGFSGGFTGWSDQSVDLTNVYTLGNVTGKSKVYIAFVFRSDPAVVYEGGYVDEVRLVGTPKGGGGGGSGQAGLVLTADAEVVPYNGSVGLVGALLDANTGFLIPGKAIDVYATQENSLTPDIVFLETLTSSTGDYSTRWSGIQKRTYFLTAFAGDTAYPGEIYSNLVKVMARASITAPAVPSTVRSYARVTSWGTIKPPHTTSQNKSSHTKVIAEHYLGGKWQSVLTLFANKYKNTATQTKYAVTVRWAPGKWRIMAVHQDDDHAKSASSWRTFTAR